MNPDAAAFDRLARAAIAGLPHTFRELVADVVVRIEEFADTETLDDLGIDDPLELTGLYHGRPLSEESVWSTGELPPMIRLFRQPLLAEWRETGVALKDLVHHVVIHEIGHHFGLSDEEMAAIEDSAD